MSKVFLRKIATSNNKILSIKAKELLKEVLKEEYLIDIYSLSMVYNEYNKPYFKNCPIYFNISHCENMIALIISNKEVGIDIEKIREIKNKEIIAKKLNIKTNSSYKIIKRFSKMEAYFKKIGTGIIYSSLNKKVKITKQIKMLDQNSIYILSLACDDNNIESIKFY